MTSITLTVICAKTSITRHNYDNLLHHILKEVVRWNKNSENKRFSDIAITKNQNQYTQIWIAPNFGSLNGSSATRAAILVGTRINQELRTGNQQRSMRLTNNGSSLSESASSHKNLHKLALRPSSGNWANPVSICLRTELSTVSWSARAWLKKTSYVAKGVEYPYFTQPLDFNNIHQADLIGPRYIKADGRFYSFNVMDLFSHRAYIQSQRTKEDRQVAASLMRCWKTIGIPDFLQIDNELSFRGSNKYPRSFGIVIKLCLYYGIEPCLSPSVNRGVTVS